MTVQTQTQTQTETSTEPPIGVFAAARWFNGVWNSTAKAVSVDMLEWQCSTWGSGRGSGDWLDTGLFRLVAEVFNLDTSRKSDGRDELVIRVPMEFVPEIVGLIEHLGESAEDWPWLTEEYEEDLDLQIARAAEVLGLAAVDLAENGDLLEALRIQ
jgi:hypothetical protein